MKFLPATLAAIFSQGTLAAWCPHTAKSGSVGGRECDFSTWCFQDEFWMTNKEANDLFVKVWREKPEYGEEEKTYIWKGEPTYEGNKRTFKRVQFSIKWDGVELVGIGSETERRC